MDCDVFIVVEYSRASENIASRIYRNLHRVSFKGNNLRSASQDGKSSPFALQRGRLARRPNALPNAASPSSMCNLFQEAIVSLIRYVPYRVSLFCPMIVCRSSSLLFETELARPLDQARSIAIALGKNTRSEEPEMRRQGLHAGDER
jgi:hypothetical protein